jgi:diguanylate cyclase (GGDEF)-like protein
MDLHPSHHARWQISSPMTLEGSLTGPGELSPAQASGLFGVTIMMVDDDSVMTDAVQAYLEEAGYRRFVSLNDPRLALETARRHRPGLLLLDLMMPGMSGFEVLAQIRSDEALRYTPIIILTASDQTANKLEALELGATEFLSKPVDSSELVLRVRNSLVFKVYQDRLASHDLLTGLPNQRVFAERLHSALVRTRQESGTLALLQLGLDRFTQINDSLGHSSGDRVLVAISRHLKACARRSGALLCRLEGDQFGLLIANIKSPDVAVRLARRILATMSRPIQHAGQELFVTCSIGISVYPGDGQNSETLRRNGAAAMRHAKSNGRNTFEFYSTELNSASVERLTLETELRRAIERGELVLHYQPKIDVVSGHVVGAEALLRWLRPRVGLVPPAEFIGIAEQIGMIVEIDEWVIATACAQMAAWRDAGLGDVKLAVNVTRQDLAAGGLVRAVGDAMARHAIGRGQLVIELTESMLVDRVEHTRKQLEELRELGCELAIDDFGTGYSSMNYLKRFPLDELKIDKSFIDGTPDSGTDCAIVKAMIVLAHSMGMRVVAEGVENAGQRDLLRSLGCDSFQGYLGSKPLAAAAFQVRMLELNAAVSG